MTTVVNQIVKEIERLDYSDKLNILSRVVKMLKQTNSDTHTHLTDLKGLGKEMWLKIDINTYVSKEREAWD